MSTNAPADCSSLTEIVYVSCVNIGGLSLTSMIKMCTIAVSDLISVVLTSYTSTCSDYLTTCMKNDMVPQNHSLLFVHSQSFR